MINATPKHINARPTSNKTIIKVLSLSSLPSFVTALEFVVISLSIASVVASVNAFLINSSLISLTLHSNVNSFKLLSFNNFIMSNNSSKSFLFNELGVHPPI